jgi:hypothetical protein
MDHTDEQWDAIGTTAKGGLIERSALRLTLAWRLLQVGYYETESR